MSFFKIKGILLISIAIMFVIGVVTLLATTNTKQLISEKAVRSQLELMYSAEVASLTMIDDVYEGIITKSGAVYLVEMNAVTGNVLSLAETNEYVIEESTEGETGSTPTDFSDEFPRDSIKIVQPSISQLDELPNSTQSIVVQVKETVSKKVADLVKSTIPSSKPMSLVESKISENAVQIITVEKVEEEKESKPSKEVTKVVLNTETSKTPEVKIEPTKVEIIKNDVDKTDSAKTETVKAEPVKVEPVKIEPVKTETEKPEVLKLEEKQKVPVQSKLVQSEPLKTEAEAKTESNVTVLITEEQAIKIAQQQHKGSIDNSSFVKTNEGGYYLIVMKVTGTESVSKESSKEKKEKATIQVHAISGKVLSVTWE